MEDIKKICQVKLRGLAKNITASDKAYIMQELPISKPTLSKYLKGNSFKIETATRIIKILTGRVNDRYGDLKGTNVN